MNNHDTLISLKNVTCYSHNTGNILSYRNIGQEAYDFYIYLRCSTLIFIQSVLKVHVFTTIIIL